ncbi:MAG: helix-turn-helix domain-containing protein [Patescibacteria group bacterium]
MRTDREGAVRLRKLGKSYYEISRALGIPKSTLSVWFKDDPMSQEVKLKLSSKSNIRVAERIKKFSENNKRKWELWRAEARYEAKKDFESLAKNPLFIAGNMLYWAEGDSKVKNPLRLTNTDPRMIRLYVKFLIRILKIDKNKIRATLILYPDLNKNSCINFWSKEIDLPRSQFYKTQFIEGRHPTSRLSRGICMIGNNSRQLKEKVLIWIDLLSKSL